MTTEQMSFGFDTASHDALPAPARAHRGIGQCLLDR